MPAKYFKCPDNETIPILDCLKHQGCRMSERCATLPFLRMVGFDREWKGISPSSAGNGPRAIYLKTTTDYIIDPNARVWAAFGTSTHDKLAIHKYSNNVLAEQKLNDDEMTGISDCLEMDEWKPGYYILTDYKTWGSFKVAKALGIVSEKTEETVMEAGKPVLLKSGKNKGQPKTVQKTTIIINPAKIDLKSEELQINRYRIFFESYQFPISKMIIQVVSRDGGTYIAKSRGIDRNLYVIPIRRLPNATVLDFYQELDTEVMGAFETSYVRKCNAWESWDRRRCEGYCEVMEACQEVSKNHGEKWGIKL